MVAPPKKDKKNTFPAKVKEAMEEILPGYPNGIRPTELAKRISESRPDIKNPIHSIRARISRVTDTYPEKFQKVKRKLGYTIYSLVEESILDEELSVDPSLKSNRREEDFYDLFAKFLKYNENEKTLAECTKAIKLGGNKFGGKWQTPDVIGLFKSEDGDVVRFTPEIVSAEIKIDDSDQALMTAFGQACSYRLFSHKTYLVVPQKANIDRLMSTCHLLGIGLVCFDSDANVLNISIFEVKLRAQKHEPDMFYVNEYLGKIAKELNKA